MSGASSLDGRLILLGLVDEADPFMAGHVIGEVYEAMLMAKQCSVDEAGRDHWQDVSDGLDELETPARAAV